jgi:hypothetical protein
MCTDCSFERARAMAVNQRERLPATQDSFFDVRIDSLKRLIHPHATKIDSL